MRRVLSTTLLALVAAEAAGAADTRAEDAALLPAESTGFVIAAADRTHAADPRLRRLAWRFTMAGIEAVVSADLSRPPPDADDRFAAARARVEEARKLAAAKKLDQAAQIYDGVLADLAACAARAEHLRALVEVLVERGAVAYDRGESASAEAVFLRALALDPSFDPTDPRVSRAAAELFRTVRDVVAKRPGGRVSVNPGALAGATVAIDFGAPVPPPFSARVGAGTHYVSVSAPDRAEVVAEVTVRANEEVTAFIRPPLHGADGDRASAVASLRAGDAASRARLAETSGLGFLTLAAVLDDGIDLEVFDTRGNHVPASAARLPRDPSDADLDRAIAAMRGAASAIEPALAPAAERETGWYATWWGISLIGIAVAGVAAGAAVWIASPKETEYVFRP